MLTPVRSFLTAENSWAAFRRLFFFCCSGTIALAIDFAVLWSLVIVLGIPHWLARIVSFIAGATFTWQFNSRLTFRDRSARLQGFAGWTTYMGTALIGGVANYAAYMLVVTVCGGADSATMFLGVAAGSLAGLGVNYSICSVWFFAKKNKPCE